VGICTDLGPHLCPVAHSGANSGNAEKMAMAPIHSGIKVEKNNIRY
jgi:hypothetical protein